MTEEKHPEEAGKKWVTVGGKRIQLDPDESAEEQIREKLPKDVRGEKEKNTKEAKKSYVKRFNLIKSKFNFRDEVLYDDMQKSGKVCGIDGDYIQIFYKGQRITRHSNNVFKKSELIGDNHWDTMEVIPDRREILTKAGISQNYIRHDWASLPAVIQDKIMKDGTPAGTGISTGTSGVWNPVNQDKSVTEKIKNVKEKNEEKHRDS